MSYEGFYNLPNPDGQQTIIRMPMDPEKVWAVTGQSKNGTQVDVLSVHAPREPDDKLKVYLSHFAAAALEVDEDGSVQLPVDPPPEHAELLGEVSEEKPHFEIDIDGGVKGQVRIVLMHVEMPQAVIGGLETIEDAEGLEPGLLGSFSLN